jgi:pimeloyl-ACP methyl ester carboxylesterase
MTPAAAASKPARKPAAKPARKPTAKPARPRPADLKPQSRELTLHGNRVHYRTAGSGEQILLLIHGITGSARQWDDVVPLLSDRYTIIAPDLLGHGESAKPKGDYSLGAYAAGVRDLLVALGHRRATVVGHSLGGGIAMQFAYEYPPFADRLVLVSSGGLGREVSALLRAATLPGAEIVLPLIASERILNVGAAVGAVLSKVGLRAGTDLAEMARGYASLGDADTRQAFLHTLRSVIEPTGQRVSATDRLYLTQILPSMIVWGERDPLIPSAHGRSAHEAMPGSRLELFEESGHFPQLHEPVRFAHALVDFIESTEPTKVDFTDADLDMFRELFLAGAAGAAAVRP